MIERPEIDHNSKELDINSSDVQRDYVFGWLLCGIYTQSELGNHLVLKGGNCLRKGYFPFGRFSGDLDFSSAHQIQFDWLASELNKVCDFVHRSAGITFDTSRTFARPKRGADDNIQIIEARVYFCNFYGQESCMVISVRIDITEWDRLYLPVQTRRLIHAYSDYTQCQADIRCVKLEEQLASKMKCLLQRRHVADLFDLVYSSILHPDFAINRAEVVSTFLRKTIFHMNPGIAKGLFLELPVAAFNGLWEKYIVCPAKSRIGFSIAGAAFQKLIAELFANVSVSHQKIDIFPAALRNPIMQAGRTLTLLDVVYHGVHRIIEPYSLLYKKRQDGVAREYFYAFDRIGGLSGPGIKAFVASGFQRIDNTGELFEPRRPVELTKAGEISGSLYFEGHPGPRKYSTARNYNYTVACHICEKQFRRRKYDVQLRPHKDKYGNRCIGRRGYVI